MDVQFITKHKVRSSVDTLSFVYALIHIRYNCLLELFYMVDYLNYRRYSVAFYLVTIELVWWIVRIVDTKDIGSAIGSPYHSDALLFVTPRSS